MKGLLTRLLHPPGWFLCTVPPAAFGLLLYLFATDRAEGILADLVFGLSAYSLTVWCLALPRLRKWLETAAERSALVRRLAASPWGGAFLRSPAFRGKVGLYRGMCSSLLYGVFWGVTGIWYGSVWFLAMAVYYLALGLLRAYLGFCCRKAGAAPSAAYAYACCRNAAWMLLLLDIPMGGMILLMVRTDSGFVYPGYVIYLSAMYTFWIFGLSVKNLLGAAQAGQLHSFRRSGPEFRGGGLVGPGAANGHDLAVFHPGGAFSSVDEFHYRRLRLRHRHRCGGVYAFPVRQGNEKSKGALSQ